jgi:tRNA modification GTPase
MDETATTAVLQTPPGRGGIAVILLSGPRTRDILSHAFRPCSPGAAHRPASRRFSSGGPLQLGHLFDECGEIDQAVVSLRAAAAEINIHGGPAVARAVLHRLAQLGADVVPAPAAAPDCFSLAHPLHDNPAIGGELLEALPRARSLLAASALARQWSGGISALARQAIDRISDPTLSRQPAPAKPSAQSEPAAAASPKGAPPEAFAAALRLAASRLPTMLRVLHPAEVVLAGPPNAGKSTLANTLVGREVSIVHETPGTTRDWVRELALLNGLPVWLTDTAGLWQATGDVDAEAVRRARHRIQQADVVVLLGAGRPGEVPPWLDLSSPRGPRLLHVAAKCDLHPPFAGVAPAVSAVTGDGLDALAAAVLAALGLADFDPAAAAAFTGRQADLLAAAADALNRGDLAASLDALQRLLA